MEKLVEKIIVEAMERGEFDDLPGKGKPLDLEEYFKLPEHLRAGYMILKNAGFVPAEAELLKEIEALRAELAASSGEDRKKRLEKAIHEKMIAFNMVIEKNRRTKRG
ncbi:MAG: DUF1992 domain-containing protein [Blastocatellia bacterium]|nr:DUF1992 domain-containing protein [Blastocatellia bacterium]